MLKDLAEYSDIDYEKTFQSRDLAFVTKEGKEFWSPVWHLYVQSLIENANAKLIAEGCHKYPRSYILLFKEPEIETTEKEKSVKEAADAVEPQKQTRTRKTK